MLQISWIQWNLGIIGIFQAAGTYDLTDILLFIDEEIAILVTLLLDTQVSLDVAKRLDVEFLSQNSNTAIDHLLIFARHNQVVDVDQHLTPPLIVQLSI